MSDVQINANPFYTDVAEAVGNLAERDLRDDVLPPLLRKLYYVDVRVLHGPREEGKDLLAWRMSSAMAQVLTAIIKTVAPDSEVEVELEPLQRASGA